MLAAAPAIAIGVLVGPVAFGLAWTLLPAFGYLPALGSSSFGLDAWRMLLAEPGLLRSCLVSLAAGLLTSAAALACVAAFIAGWSHTRAFRVMEHAISPLLAIPHAAAAFGLAFLLAPSGWFLRLVHPLTGFDRPPDWLIVHDPLGLAMMGGLFVKELPFLFLVTLAALPQAGARDGARIAASLGYGRMAGFLHAVWPRVYPQIRLAVFAVIAYSSSVVDVALILGPTNPPPLSVRLVRWMSDPDLTMRFLASAGAVLQLLVTALALGIWLAGERLVSRLARHLAQGGRRHVRDGVMRNGVAAVVMSAAAAAFLGLAMMALWSLARQWNYPDALPAGLTFANWSRYAPSLAQPFANTVTIALAAALVAVALTTGSLELESRRGRRGAGRALPLIYLPLIVPQTSFVFGLQMFFLTLGIDASAVALVGVHLVFVLPYVLLSLSDPWRAFDPRYAQAALSMGASPDRVFWRVRAPMLLRPILAAAAIGFAVSVGQYLPTLLVGGGRWPTITTEAVALASGGDRRLIGVFAFLQMLLPFAGFLAAAAIPAFLHRDRRAMRAGGA
jgi:putative thiamine transport system permease protein